MQERDNAILILYAQLKTTETIIKDLQHREQSRPAATE